MNRSVFPAQYQHQLEELRVGIIGSGLPVDSAIANLAGLGIQTIYVCDNKSNERLFRERFLEQRYPNLIYVEDEEVGDFKERNDLEYILKANPNTDSIEESLNIIKDIDYIRKNIYTFADWEPKEHKENLQPRYNANNQCPSTILAVGAGGIGNYFALGIHQSNHKVLLVDDDIFDKSNLNRQIFAEIGKNKAETIAKYIPNITPITRRFDQECILELDSSEIQPDYVIGCVDNTRTRNLLKKYSLQRNIPYFDGGVDVSSGRIDLNPKEFRPSKEEIQEESSSCAQVKNPSVVVPNAIVGLQLARCLNTYQSYSFSYDTLQVPHFAEEINGEYI